MKKLLILIVLFATVCGFFFFDLHQVLTLENIKARQGEFLRWRDQSPLLVSLGFFAIYVLVTALSLPGATIMTLAGGGFFGLVWGFVIISFASSIGATLAFLAARYLLRDWCKNGSATVWRRLIIALNGRELCTCSACGWCRSSLFFSSISSWG